MKHAYGAIAGLAIVLITTAVFAQTLEGVKAYTPPTNDGLARTAGPSGTLSGGLKRGPGSFGGSVPPGSVDLPDRDCGGAGGGFAQGSAELGGQVYLKKHSVDVRIVDGVAITEIDQTFHNTTGRQMEATWVCPLPANAVIDEFSIYMAGRRELGTVMERTEARRIYDRITARRVDPGLVEMGDGWKPAIRTRIFPIPPRGDMRVTTRYAHALARSGSDHGTRLSFRGLSPAAAPPISALKVEVEARSTWPLGEVAAKGFPLGLHESCSGRVWRGTARARDARPEEDLRIRCRPNLDSAGLALHVHTTPAGERIFMAVIAAGPKGLDRPVLSFRGGKARDVYPSRLDDIPARRQALVFGRLEGTVPPVISLAAKSGGRDVHRDARADRSTKVGRGNRFVAAIWARHRVRELIADGSTKKQEVVALAVKYGILTRYTSILAR